MSRHIALILALVLLVGCGSSSKRSSDFSQSGDDTAVNTDQVGPSDSTGGAETTSDSEPAPDGDLNGTEDLTVPGDGLVQSDQLDLDDDALEIEEDVPLVFPDSVSPIPGCVTSCGGTSCGAGICYVCVANDQCVDVTPSLWDIGLWNQAVWGP
ncbi:MAG: hypothetical protein KC609_00535 [Myxococcales bacterium]|nr:hypothetical protein [Myxococcales bacterium]